MIVSGSADANIRLDSGRGGSAVVHWAEVDPAPAAASPGGAGLIGDHTRLVAVTAASNVIGTRRRQAITAMASARGAGLRGQGT